jgi:hypothetical protein
LAEASRLLWLTTWKMIGFILNGFAFVLIGLLDQEDLHRDVRAARAERQEASAADGALQGTFADYVRTSCCGLPAERPNALRPRLGAV